MTLNEFNEYLEECSPQHASYIIKLKNNSYEFKIYEHPYEDVKIYVPVESLSDGEISLSSISALNGEGWATPFSNRITDEELVYVFGMTMEDLMYLKMTYNVKKSCIENYRCFVE